VLSHCSLLIAHCLALLPLEHAFFEDVKVANRDEDHEGQRFPEDVAAKLAVGDRERVEERGFNVENDEQHGDEVEVNWEAFSSRANRVIAAFVGHEFGAARFFWSKHRADDQGEHADASGDDEHDDDVQEFVQRSISPRVQQQNLPVF
jgi:hypothetical protein